MLGLIQNTQFHKERTKINLEFNKGSNHKIKPLSKSQKHTQKAHVKSTPVVSKSQTKLKVPKRSKSIHKKKFNSNNKANSIMQMIKQVKSVNNLNFQQTVLN